jgi:hypothetical protein
MSVATEQTTKHFVDLWQTETTLRRRRIVIEAPSEWTMENLSSLDGEQLARLADEYGSDSEWEIEDVEPHDVERIDVSGPVEVKFPPDIVFKANNEGDLIDYETGDLASFNF